jgi:hypothetical protein
MRSPAAPMRPAVIRSGRTTRWRLQMILVRTVLQGKFGTGGQLATAMRDGNAKIASELGLTNRWRILTDLSGGFDRVVLEIVAEDMADWERQRVALFSHPSFGELMGRTAGMIEGGYNEFYTIEGEG